MKFSNFVQCFSFLPKFFKNSLFIASNLFLIYYIYWLFKKVGQKLKKYFEKLKSISYKDVQKRKLSSFENIYFVSNY